MSYASWLWGIVDWISVPIAAAVAGILVRRKLYREFPFFFSFLVVTTISGALRFEVQFRNAELYFYVFWVSELVGGIFNILAVYELVVLRLFPRFYKIRAYRYLFGAAAAVVVSGLWLTAFEARNTTAALVMYDRGLDFVVVIALGFFVGLMLLMGREWRKYDFGIAAGFILGNAGTLIGSAVWIRSLYRSFIADELQPIAYDIATLIWLYYFWSGDKRSGQASPPTTTTLNPEMLDQARSWETTLKGWREKNKH